MGIFLLRFWPVLLPFLVYIFWMMRVRRHARKAGEAVPDFREGPWFWAVVATLLVALLLFLILGLSHSANQGEYTPPHMENGHIIPGGVHAP